MGRGTTIAGTAAGKGTKGCRTTSWPSASGRRRISVCLLFLANGIPMFVAGDEFLRTQQGNNNPYNQDNETTWLDWSLQGLARRPFSIRPANDRLPQGPPVVEPFAILAR